MPPPHATSVLVVGAGPVGLTLAMDLAWRGIDVLVVETRDRGEPPSVKCNHVAARTMEVFRRLGVARAVRDAVALPPDYPNDVSFRTTTTGREFARIHIPCRRDRYTDKSGPDGWWPTPEPPHRINQIYLEPVLFAHAAALPGVRILNRTKLTGFEQRPDCVLATALDLDTGKPVTIAAAYMVGCDGAQSEVRRAIHARLSGDPVVQRTQSSYIRAPDLIRRMQAQPAWSTQSLNPRRSANMFAIDGHETWLIHNYLRLDETSFDAVDRDRCIRLILGVGP
ncbi:MAG TPA: FAD-dependent monooxygenase, partial [Acetobacteraceae bacterium]|nr:FAD-dependent monooxygenase [Acetobacteraceae bacterium]